MFLHPAESAQLIAAQMDQIRINNDAVDGLAKLLLEKVASSEYDLAKWKADNPLHPQTANDAAVDWIFLVDSLNFSFWPDAGQEFTIDGQVGYWALAAAVTRAEREGIPLTDPAFYSALTLEQAANIFRTDQPGIPIPMLTERVEVLNTNGKILLEKFGGTFVRCIEEAKGSAIRLLEIVCESFPSFRDEGVYKGQRVSFLKRAQILIADLWGCFEGLGHGTFEDIDQLTMFADYRIPQALHYFEVLLYSPELTQRLQANHLLEAGSEEEIQIRGASIHAVELIRQKMRQLAQASDPSSSTPNSIQLDFYLWGFRRDNAAEIDLKSPYHKVRSVFY